MAGLLGSGGDSVGAAVGAAVVVDPADHGVDVLEDLLAGAGCPGGSGLEHARPNLAVDQQDEREQQGGFVQWLHHVDRGDDGLDDNPGVGA